MATSRVVQGGPGPGRRAAIWPRQSKEAAAVVTGQGPVTITDAARLAGVSPGTAPSEWNEEWGRRGVDLLVREAPMNLRQLGRAAGQRLLAAVDGRPGSGLQLLPAVW